MIFGVTTSTKLFLFITLLWVYVSLKIIDFNSKILNLKDRILILEKRIPIVTNNSIDEAYISTTRIQDLMSHYTLEWDECFGNKLIPVTKDTPTGTECIWTNPITLEELRVVHGGPYPGDLEYAVVWVSGYVMTFLIVNYKELQQEGNI